MYNRSTFSIYLANLGKYNEGELSGEWVSLPATSDEIQEVLDKIGIDGIRYEETFIADYDISISGLAKSMGEFESLDALNYLAERIQDCDIEWLEAVLELGECTGSVMELINLLENQDCFMVLNDIENDYDLGYFYLHETWGDRELTERLGLLSNYLDYESFGRDVRLSEGGVYSGNGCYVILVDSPIMLYKSIDDIPDEFRICA